MPSQNEVLTAERVSGTISFHLWHRDIFKPEYQGWLGDPTGKCRTFDVDVVQGQIIRETWWR